MVGICEESRVDDFFDRTGSVSVHALFGELRRIKQRSFGYADVDT